MLGININVETHGASAMDAVEATCWDVNNVCA